jgi:hypothetical protein
MARQQIEKRKAEKRAETIKANKEKKVDAVGGREGMRDKKPKVKEEEEMEAAGSKRKRRGQANGDSKKAKVEEEVNMRCEVRCDWELILRNPISRKSRMDMTRNPS